MTQEPGLFPCPACGGIVATTAASCPHCGHRPTTATATGSLNVAAAIILLGGVLVAIGAFLPWATASTAFGSLSRSGLEGGDGIFVLPLGAVIGLLGLTRLQRPGLPGNRLTMVLLGVISLGAAWFEGSRIQGNIDSITTSYVTATLGAGIYVIGVGGALVLLASLFGGDAPSPQPTLATPPD